jgi:hypothetical protein
MQGWMDFLLQQSDALECGAVFHGFFLKWAEELRRGGGEVPTKGRVSVTLSSVSD